MATQVGLDRGRVIAAAADLADEHGFHAVTLAMLAAELGVRSQSLYAHVDGIDGLRRDLALRGQQLLADDLRSAAMALSGRDAIFAIARAFERFASAHPGLYAASLRAPGTDPDLSLASSRAMEPLVAVLRSYGLDGEDITHEYRALWSAIHGYADLRNRGLMSFPADADVSFDRMIAAFADDLERRRS
jgi:AcrR family transcriptional regulator